MNIPDYNNENTYVGRVTRFSSEKNKALEIYDEEFLRVFVGTQLYSDKSVTRIRQENVSSITWDEIQALTASIHGHPNKVEAVRERIEELFNKDVSALFKLYFG